MTALPIADTRRRVAAVTQGLTRMLIFVQAAYQDVRGALHAGQRETFQLQVRSVIIDCLSSRNAARSGEVSWTNDSVTSDPFAGDPEELGEALSLLRDAALVTTEAEGLVVVERLGRFVADTEAQLGFSEPLPELRSPNGMFGAIKLARGAFEAVDVLGLPSLLPAEWLGQGDGETAPGSVA